MYVVEQILDEKDILELKKLYQEIPPRFAHQDYNLFDVERKDIPVEKIEKHKSLLKLKTYSKMSVKGFYFLKYEKDSFTRVHHDDNSELTIVTMIEAKNLVGGCPICYTKYTKNARPSFKYARRNEQEQKVGPTGKDIVPVVIEVKETQSIVYGPNLKHGVSCVQGGHRIVLISWFYRR